MAWSGREDAAFKVYRKRLKEFDVIHDCSHRKVAGRLKSNLPQIAILWHAWSMGGVNYPEPKYNLMAVGKWHAEEMARQYNQATKYVYWGIDDEFYKPAENQQIGDYYLTIGHPHPFKGTLDAIRMCLATKSKLKIIGGQIPGEDNSYANQCHAMCDGKMIEWIGEVSHERKRDELAGAVALLHPIQQDEGGSLTIAESLSCGTPVIATHRGEYPEMVPNTVGVTCRSEPEFEKILSQKNALLSFDRKKIREYAVQKFGMATCLKNYMQVYKEVSEGLRW